MVIKMKTEITIEDIDKLSHLSALEFTDEEKSRLITQMSDVVGMLNVCAGIDTSSVKYSNIVDLEDLREDEVEVGLSNEKALLNAPKARKGFFNVPRVVE